MNSQNLKHVYVNCVYCGQNIEMIVLKIEWGGGTLTNLTVIYCARHEGNGGDALDYFKRIKWGRRPNMNHLGGVPLNLVEDMQPSASREREKLIYGRKTSYRIGNETIKI